MAVKCLIWSVTAKECNYLQLYVATTHGLLRDTYLVYTLTIVSRVPPYFQKKKKTLMSFERLNWFARHSLPAFGLDELLANFADCL